MPEGRLHVLVVDDSAVVRETVSRLLGRIPGWQVTTAVDSVIALERIRRDRPDVVLLDLEMPRMDGLTLLRHLMATDPVPVVVCSSHADHGTETALAALELGAVEIFPKPRLGWRACLDDSGAALTETLRRAAAAGPALKRGWRRQSRHRVPSLVQGPARAMEAPRKASPVVASPKADSIRGSGQRTLLIGASMGGSEAVRHIVSELPVDGPPCLVVLHMPHPFTSSFARRLNQQSAMEVREAATGEAVVPGRVLVAPGGRHMTGRRGPAGVEIEVTDEGAVKGHRPSVDVLFHSAARVIAEDAVAVILTGMGDDGSEGLMALQRAGASTLAQDKATSTIFGMPRAAIELGAARDVLPLECIGARMLTLARTTTLREAGPEAEAPEAAHPRDED